MLFLSALFGLLIANPTNKFQPARCETDIDCAKGYYCQETFCLKGINDIEKRIDPYQPRCDPSLLCTAGDYTCGEGTVCIDNCCTAL